MSRIGKQAINIADKVEVKVLENMITVKGPKGTLSKSFSKAVTVESDSKLINVKPVDNSKEALSNWGTVRTILNNMVQGVSAGFIKTLEFNGVGYKASVSGNILTLSLGYSHSIDYPLPAGIEAKVVKNTIEIAGCDKELVGFVAAKVRSMRPPEPYKGKGVKYIDEKIIRKAGKTGGKK